MRYTVEIDTTSKKGSEALKYLQNLHAGKVISIYQSKRLAPEDVALPTGIIPTAAQWEEFLNRRDGKGIPAGKAFNKIRERLNKKLK